MIYIYIYIWCHSVITDIKKSQNILYYDFKITWMKITIFFHNLISCFTIKKYIL